jgi:FdhD protein
MQSSVQLPVIKLSGDSARSGPDLLAIEEPLEIRLAVYSPQGGAVQNLAVTMRTPGNDTDLALGFLFTEGIIADPAAVQDIRHLAIPCSENKQNTILVTLRRDVLPNLGKSERNFYTTSSCGVCGKASIEAIRTVSHATRPGRDQPPIDPALILGLPDTLAGVQEIFADTGGLHAAALFDGSGKLLLVREDVGRHNALDKLIGAALLSPQPGFDQSILLLSGRASFELVQKAAMAGIPLIAAVGAPSSLAVSLAEEFGITLIGFLRTNRFNIYSVPHRIQLPIYESSC